MSSRFSSRAQGMPFPSELDVNAPRGSGRTPRAWLRLRPSGRRRSVVSLDLAPNRPSPRRRRPARPTRTSRSCRTGSKRSTRAAGRAIRNGSRSPSSRATARRSSPASRAKPTPGGCSSRYLWVSDALRRQGIGRELMRAAEGRAIERGCHSAWVDTLASRRRASIASSATRRSANSTIRRTSSASSSGSGLDEARARRRPGGGAKSKPTATKTKLDATKSKPSETKSKLGATKSK